MTDTGQHENTSALSEVEEAEAALDATVSKNTDPKTTVGEMLKQGREKRAKSVMEAARGINLPSNYVAALELDEFDKLPGDAFTRGYLRNYCRWLELDEDELLALYIVQSGLSKSVELGVEFKPRQPSLKKSASSRKAVGALLAVVFLVFGFWLFNDFGGSSELEQEPEELSAEISVDTFSGKPLDDKGGLYSDDGADEGLKLSTGTSSQTDWENPFGQSVKTEQAAADVKKNLPAKTKMADVGSGETAVITNRGAGPDKLIFTFTGDCWLDIQDANGKKIYSNIRKAGQVLNLQGQAPFNVMIGNAKAVSLVFNGKAVSVKSRNKLNSVRLHLGEQ